MTPAPSTITFIGNALRRVVERQTQATCPGRRSLCLLGLRDSVTPWRPYVAPSADPPPQGWSLSRRLTTLLQYRDLSVYGRFRLRWCVNRTLSCMAGILGSRPTLDNVAGRRHQVDQK